MEGMGAPWEIIRDGSVSVPIYRQVQATTTVHSVTWYEGGKRLRKTFSDPAKARAHAKQIARGLAKLGSSSLTLTGEELLAYCRARQMLDGEPVDVAVSELIEARKLSGRHVIEAARAWGKKQKPDAPQVQAVVTEFLAAKAASGRSKAHVDDLRKRLDRFGSAFRVSLSLVNARQIETWVRSLDLAPRSQRNFVGAISSLLHWAERREHLARGQIDLSGIEIERTLSNVQTFTPDALARLLAAAEDPRMVAYLTLGAFAGLRTAEILRIDWEHIRADHIDVRAENSKTRQRRLVPVLPALSSWLDPIRSTGRVCDWYGLQKPLGRLAKRAGVAWVHNGLRHSFGTYRMALIQSEQQVALEMGNSPAMIFAHYRANATEAAAREWFAVTAESHSSTRRTQEPAPQESSPPESTRC